MSCQGPIVSMQTELRSDRDMENHFPVCPGSIARYDPILARPHANSHLCPTSGMQHLLSFLRERNSTFPVRGTREHQAGSDQFERAVVGMHKVGPELGASVTTD